MCQRKVETTGLHHLLFTDRRTDDVLCTKIYYDCRVAINTIIKAIHDSPLVSKYVRDVWNM